MFALIVCEKYQHLSIHHHQQQRSHVNGPRAQRCRWASSHFPSSIKSNRAVVGRQSFDDDERKACMPKSSSVVGRVIFCVTAVWVGEREKKEHTLSKDLIRIVARTWPTAGRHTHAWQVCYLLRHNKNIMTKRQKTMMSSQQ